MFMAMFPSLVPARSTCTEPPSGSGRPRDGASDDFPGNAGAAERLGMRGIVVGEDIDAAIARLDAPLAGD